MHSLLLYGVRWRTPRAVGCCVPTTNFPDGACCLSAADCCDDNPDCPDGETCQDGCCTAAGAGELAAPPKR
jgi:hypothetical protein